MAYDYGFASPYMSAFAPYAKSGVNPPRPRSGTNPPRPPTGLHPPKPGPISHGPDPRNPNPIGVVDPIQRQPGMTDRYLNYQDYTDFERDMTNSRFVRDFLEPDLERGVYDRYFLDRNGYVGPDNRARFMRGNMGRAEQAYENQLLSTPDLRFSDFLKGYTGLADEWVNMSASQRGMNVPTRTQVIRWG